MNEKHFFAVDLGATSGRTILGTIGDSDMAIREITRFSNPIIETCGHSYWDIYALFSEIIKGLKAIAKEEVEIESIGIDTWGVDFVFIAEDGELLRQPYSYRDLHTVGAPEVFFERFPREEVYEKTGIQVMNFNTLFQLDTIRRNSASVLSATDKVVFIPDALSYMLTGEIVTEYTIASTSQLLDAHTKEFDTELLDAVGLRRAHFGRMVHPGTVIGRLNKDVQTGTGLKAIPVIAVAGHDTASAVAAIPAGDECFAYLSSGTWSLMGIETEKPIINEESYAMNFTNEGGVAGKIRFLKNICGMWLLECCRREWDSKNSYSYAELIEMALEAAPLECLINPDAPCFANPTSMVKAIQTYCRETGQKVPQACGEIIRCIFESLALRYKQVFEYLQHIAPFPINCLHVIGGGSKNNLLNQFTANALGVKVVAGPSEATAIGNIMLQAKAANVMPDFQAMRNLACKSIRVTACYPQDKDAWESAYARYRHIYRDNI